jgi:hypothetical protein
MMVSSSSYGTTTGFSYFIVLNYLGCILGLVYDFLRVHSYFFLGGGSFVDEVEDMVVGLADDMLDLGGCIFSFLFMQKQLFISIY